MFLKYINFKRCTSFPEGCFLLLALLSSFQSEKDNLCWGRPCLTLVNLRLSSFRLCSLCSKSNEHTCLVLLSRDIFCFSFLKIVQFSQGLRVLFNAVEAHHGTKFFVKQINRYNLFTLSFIITTVLPRCPNCGRVHRVLSFLMVCYGNRSVLVWSETKSVSTVRILK